MDLDKTCRKLAKELNEDFDVVKSIVMFEWKFAKDIMQNPNDDRDILFNKLFKFKLKSRFKDDKTKKYTPNGRKENNSYNEK